MTRYLTAENVFLAILAFISSATTYLGLRESLQEGMLAAGILSEVLSASIGLSVFVMIVWCWKFLQGLIENGAYKTCVLMTLVWLPILFGASTWWSVVGISGGTAIRYELTSSEQKWRDQVDDVFANRREQVQTSLAAVTTTKGLLDNLASGEVQGLTTGLVGTGPVSRCYTRMGGALGQLESTLTDKVNMLTTGHQQTAAMIDAIAANRQQNMPTRELVAVYQTGGNQLQAAVAEKATLGDLSRSVEATKQIMVCPEIEGLQEAQKRALEDIKTRMDALTFTDNSSGDQKMELDEVAPVHKAIFTQAGQIVPGWATAVAMDMLPLFLLVGALVSSRKRALEEKGIGLSLESLREQHKLLEEKNNTALAAFNADKARLEAELEQKREEIALRIKIEGEFSPQAKETLEKQVANLRGTINDLRQEAIILGMQLDDKHDELARRADLTEVNQLLNKDAQRRRGEIESLSGQTIVLNSRIAAAEERRDTLQARVNELEKMTGDMQKDALLQDTEILGLEAQKEQDRKWIETVEADRDAALKKVHGLQTRLLDREDELRVAQQDLASSSGWIATMRGHHEVQIASLREQLETAQTRADEAERRLLVIHTQFKSDKP